jgi:hypothetical protein
MTAIEAHADVRHYFHERLTQALQRQRVEMAAETEFYLVNLLSGFAERGGDEDPGSATLVELLGEATAATGGERLKRFRRVGDFALFILGFFSDNLDRRGISHGYVIAVGGNAYWVARNLARDLHNRRWVTRPGVYHELAEKFEDLANVLGEVREDTALRTPQDILKLYERWRQTGSPRLAERLREEGVVPALTGSDDTVH